LRFKLFSWTMRSLLSLTRSSELSTLVHSLIPSSVLSESLNPPQGPLSSLVTQQEYNSSTLPYLVHKMHQQLSVMDIILSRAMPSQPLGSASMVKPSTYLPISSIWAHSTTRTVLVVSLLPREFVRCLPPRKKGIVNDLIVIVIAFWVLGDVFLRVRTVIHL
jgi:hypothetical protein